jgi:hypothetical protein
MNVEPNNVDFWCWDVGGERAASRGIVRGHQVLGGERLSLAANAPTDAHAGPKLLTSRLVVPL